MNSRRDRGKEKKHSSRCTPRKNWVCGVGWKETDWKGEKKEKKRKENEQMHVIHLNFPPYFHWRERKIEKKKKT